MHTTLFCVRKQGPLDPASQAPRATPNPLEHSNITDIRYDEDYLRFYQ